MRIHPSCLALPLLLAALAGPPATAQYVEVRSVGVDLDPRSAARITRLNGESFARGDTLRVRSVLVNLSDTVVVADANPCDLRFGGELALEPLGGEQACRAMAVRLTPGDSAWTERAAVVASPPGRYAMEFRNGAFTHRGRALLGVSGSTSEVSVVERGARPGPVLAPIQRGSPAIFPVVLRFRDETGTGVTERDAEEIVQATVRRGGSGIALPMHPNAPAAAAASEGVSYLDVVLEREAGGAARRTIAWVDRRAGPCGSVAERTGGNVVRSPVAYGAELAMWIHENLERIRGQGCMSAPRRLATAR
ncbi:MAG TPA: hypothetical protein VGV85_07450 [Longimicrobiaceae bacterium]|nr:hypothetical protein [Longimicrobiaceae bacterium]